MSSEASNSPLKSTASENLSKSTATTSVPDISSFSSSSSSRSRQEIGILKKKIELLKVQLRQKDLELNRNLLEKEAGATYKGELKYFKLKCDTLSAVCEQLNQWITACETDEEVRIKQLEQVFRKQLEQVNDIARTIKEENGLLKADLRACETKIGSIIHENGYLRWENGSLSEEIGKLKEKLEEELAKGRFMKGELTKLRTAHGKCAAVERRERELSALLDKSTSTVEKMKRVQEDREKEYGITITRLRNELDFVRGEGERKEEVAKGLIDMIDKLSHDNRVLQDRIEEKERQEVRECEERLRQRMAGGAWTREDTDAAPLQLGGSLKEELEAERKWREELCAIHVEMSKDMRRLLQLAKSSCAHHGD